MRNLLRIPLLLTTIALATPVAAESAAHAPVAAADKVGKPPDAGAHAAAAAHPVGDARPPAKIWEELRAGNERFLSGRPATRRLVTRRLETAKGQAPGAMILACADSRVSPELLFDADLGELFVVRVAGNIADPAGVGSLEYGAEHLGSKVLVVLGHERCGAVTAALAGGAMPTKSLKALVAELTPNLRAVPGKGAEPERVDAGVEANVRATVEELLATSPVLKERVAKGELLLLGAVYDLDSGKVRVLEAPGASSAPEAKPAGATVH